MVFEGEEVGLLFLRKRGQRGEKKEESIDGRGNEDGGGLCDVAFRCILLILLVIGAALGHDQPASTISCWCTDAGELVEAFLGTEEVSRGNAISWVVESYYARRHGGVFWEDEELPGVRVTGGQRFSVTGDRLWRRLFLLLLGGGFRRASARHGCIRAGVQWALRGYAIASSRNQRVPARHPGPFQRPALSTLIARLDNGAHPLNTPRQLSVRGCTPHARFFHLRVFLCCFGNARAGLGVDMGEDGDTSDTNNFRAPTRQP